MEIKMIFDIATGVFVLGLSVFMMKRGGVRAVLSFGGLIISIIVASLTYPVLTDGIYATPLPENLNEIVKESMGIKNGEAADEASIEALPDFMKKPLVKKADEIVGNVAEAVADSVTRTIVNIITFVLLLVVTKIIIAFLTTALNLATKLPGISQLNSLVGLGCGVVMSLLIVWVAAAFISSMAVSNPVMAEWIDGSAVAGIMSNVSPF